ncbi:hypothetical protein F5Y18DRAFT_380047 [Xylariaceae sp. FL1019]|nr:hypothetical protein F5Y18DRAFT_380047 [Xylariaceae sp. FL1019]
MELTRYRYLRTVFLFIAVMSSMFSPTATLRSRSNQLAILLPPDSGFYEKTLLLPTCAAAESDSAGNSEIEAICISGQMTL